MRKNRYQIILAAALAFFIAACSESSSSLSDSESNIEEILEDGESTSTETISSNSTEEISSGFEEFSSSSAEAISSSSEIIDSSSSEMSLSPSGEEEVSSSSQETEESSSSELIEESSSSNEEQSSSSFEEPESSSSDEELYSSSSDEEVSSSSFEEIQSSSSLEEDILSEECIALRSVRDTFPQVTDLLKCLHKTEKIAFILRHSERDKSKSGTTDPLNDNGRKLAYELGEKLKDEEDIYFMHTRVYRTMETILKIVEGKGQRFSESTIPFSTQDGVDQMETADLEESYMIRNNDKFQECRGGFGWSWSLFTYAAYEDDVSPACQEGFYDADDRLAEFINTYFTYEKMHNVTIGISHDKLLAPFVIAAGNRQVHLQFHEHEGDYNYWINYLTGIAIIVGEDGSTTILPATGMNDPYLRVFPDDY